MRSRFWVHVFAVALIANTSCGDNNITNIGEGFDDTATWVAILNGANERPTPNTSPATGRAWFIDHGTSITYYIEYSGLVAPASNAHIHRGTADQPPGAGGTMVQLPYIAGQTSGVVSGVINMTLADVAELETGAQTAAELRQLMDNGGAYVNIHSNSGTTPQTGFPGGEIRGQIRRR